MRGESHPSHTPSLQKENKQDHSVALAKAQKPCRRISDARIGASFRSRPPDSCPQPPASRHASRLFLATPAAARGSYLD